MVVTAQQAHDTAVALRSAALAKGSSLTSSEVKSVQSKTSNTSSQTTNKLQQAIAPPSNVLTKAIATSKSSGPQYTAVVTPPITKPVTQYKEDTTVTNKQVYQTPVIVEAVGPSMDVYERELSKVAQEATAKRDASEVGSLERLKQNIVIPTTYLALGAEQFVRTAPQFAIRAITNPIQTTKDVKATTTGIIEKTTKEGDIATSLGQLAGMYYGGKIISSVIPTKTTKPATEIPTDITFYDKVKVPVNEYGALGKSDLITAKVYPTKYVAPPTEINIVQTFPTKIQADSLSLFKKASTEKAITSAVTTGLERSKVPNIEFFAPKAEFAKQMQINRLKSGADVFAIDLTKGKASFRPKEEAFPQPKPEVLQFLEVKEVSKPAISELQALVLERFKKPEVKAVEVIKTNIPKQITFYKEPPKSIREVKFEKPKTPEGFTQVKTKQGMIQFLKSPEVVSVQKPVVFTILSTKQIAELVQKSKQKVQAVDLIQKTRTSTFYLPSTLTGVETVNAFGQKTEPTLFLATKTKQETTPITQFRITTIPRTELVPQTKTTLDLIPMTMTKQGSALKTDVATKLDTKTRLDVSTLLDLKQRTNTRTKTRTNLRSYLDLKTETRMILPKSSDNKLFKLKPTKKKKKSSGFDVFIKRKGKFKPLGVSLERKQAGLFAMKKLKESLGATAMVRPSGKAATQSNIFLRSRPGEFRQYLQKKGKRAYDPNLYVQNVGFRLGTRREVSEIKASKRKGRFF